MKSSPVKPFGETWRMRLVCFLLGVSTLIIYWRVHNFEFINFDDPVIIYKNPMVTNGLTLAGLRWGLTTSFYEYWHPITWWSHMLDWELFGPNAGGQHLVSVAFHIANTLLLFAMLWEMTGRLTRSAIVAALFALHPMHVESVVWLAERKDLLSTFFWLLSIWAYARYIFVLKSSRERAELFYRLSAVFFLFGLMSKPMVVTLPFVLLLLDYWPLNRFQIPVSGTEQDVKGLSLNQMSRTFLTLVQEKLPFFGLALFSCVITFSNVRAGGTMLSAQVVPWSFRLANVPVSYGRYLGKLVYPVNLSAFYPTPAHWPAWLIAVSLVVLFLVTALVLKFLRPAPYLAVGWFMFLGILVPTLSLVPVGTQSIADRYTYLPYIGFFIAAVWSVAEISIRWKYRVPILCSLTALVLLACCVMTWFQVGYWQNNLVLWPHCLAVTTNNYPAENNLGTALSDAGKPAEAIPYYLEGVRLRPDFFEANYNLGQVYVLTGQFKQAAHYLIKANQLRSDYPDAHLLLGEAFYGLGDFVGAETECSEAVRLNPSNFYAVLYLARALDQENKFDDAVHYFSEALRINPASPEAHYYLGSEYLKRGMLEDAISNLVEALSLKPSYAEARKELEQAQAMAKRSAPKPATAP